MRNIRIMKDIRIIFSTVAVFAAFFAQSINAQNVRVFLKDGTSQTFQSVDVDSVVFDADNRFYPTAVDLGLSVKWATCNLGAEQSQEIGNYYSWGETEPKEQYSKTTYFDPEYKYYAENNDTCFSGKPEYDVAKKAWGNEWRVPTDTELKELVDKCKWKAIRHKGCNGYRITGPNGNQIFLPASGEMIGKSCYSAQECGYYWSASQSKAYDEPAYQMYFSTSSREITINYKYLGFNIRPVMDKSDKTEQ